MARLTRVALFFFRDPRLFMRYISAGAVAALIEFLLFIILYQVSGWPLLTANGVALAIAAVVCFVLQKKWTFRIHGETRRQLRWYLFMQAISAILNNFLVFGLVHGLGLYAPLAKILQIGLVFAWNFSFCRLVVFVPQGDFSTLGNSSEK